MTSDRDRSVSASGVKDNTPSPSFAGFAEPNYTQIPNHFLDNWLPYLTGAEAKVLLYVFRRTFGFQRKSDAIGLRQICNGIPGKDQGTGLHMETAVRAAQTLVAKGALRVEGEGKRRRRYYPVMCDPPAKKRRQTAAAEGGGNPKLLGKSEQLSAPQTARKIRAELLGKSEQICTENPSTQKKGNNGKKETSSSPVPDDLRAAVRRIVPAFDDDAVRTLWASCRKAAPDCTAEEVADIFDMKAAQILKGRSVRNPVGLLLASVPKCFEGGESAYRKQPQTATAATAPAATCRACRSTGLLNYDGEWRTSRELDNAVKAGATFCNCESGAMARELAEIAG